ncbi:DUF2470 domain-containing protein [Streptomyces sp. NPDC057638]|uniref:DUF2470 domain-containing protein n=1 Tax=Streptomyces sp. NPDC057638 TaxID=3346190 RepID=UPI0036A82405
MPSAAERTRTLVQGTCSAVLLIPGVSVTRPDQLAPRDRVVDDDGEIRLRYPADSPAVRAAAHAQDDELTAVLELTDVAPVSVPHRIRGRAWVTGWLTRVPDTGHTEPGTAELRLHVGELYVDDLWGAASVDPEEFTRATADPLVAHETELLQHLHAAHADRLQELCGLLGERAESAQAATGTTVQRAVPLALDRFGLRIRFVGHGCFDARFDFPEPVGDITGLRRAMRTLFDAAAR